MTPIRKALLTSVAGLVLAFSHAGAALAQQQAPANDRTPLATITEHYNTKASRDLAALEARYNANRPAGAPRVTFLDPDQMSAWLNLNQVGAREYPSLVAQYLQAKSAGGLSPQEIVAIAQVSFTMQTGTFAPQLTNPALSGKALERASAVVVPYNPNQSADAFMAQAFEISNPETGESVDALDGLALAVPITREQMMQIVNGREAWRTADTRFLPQVNRTDGFTQAMVLHRAEVYTDVAGLMQAVKDGADPALIGHYADWKGTLVALTETPRTKVFAPGEMPYYGAIIHDSYAALKELQARISRMGADNFRKLSPTEMQQLAYDITDSKALTADQATHLLGAAAMGDEYFRILEQNKVSPALVGAARDFVQTVYGERTGAAQRAVKPQDMGEALAGALREFLGGGTPQVTPWQMYGFLEQKIKGDAEVAANPGSIPAHLRARQRLMDETRKMLDEKPEQAAIIRQVIQGIFTSDPLLREAPEPPAQQRRPQPDQRLQRA